MNEPFTIENMHDPDLLPDKMVRLMVNRGLEPTLGLRFMAIDLANLAATGEPKYGTDATPVDRESNSLSVENH